MKEIKIKTLLVEYLLKQCEDLIIASEVPFFYGTRRADIVSISQYLATAFEIKGAGDSTDRLEYQISSYKSYFDFCYVVCEKSNINQIRNKIPREIGLIIATEEGIIPIRKSKQFKQHDKQSLMSALPVDNLRKITGNRKLRSKHELCEYAANQFPLAKIRTLSRNYLESRYYLNSNILKNEIEEKLNSDDILTITRMPPQLLVRRA
jgi:hypothetical protein